MSGFDDYPGDMLDSKFTDTDIELLLSAATPDNQELADLAVYVEFIRNAGRWIPTESQIALVSSQAAEIARSTIPARGIPGNGRRTWRFKPQVAVTSAAVLLVFTFAGLAAASNDAAPGEPLYAIDLALERIGIGAGHVQERLEEANTLLASGKSRLALAHAAEAIDLSTADAAEVAGLEEAKAALIEAAELIDEGQGPDALMVHENVSALFLYIEESIHEGAAADRKEFGQRVAAIAREISTERNTPRPGGEPDVEEADQPEPAESPTGPPVSVPGDGATPPQGGSNNSEGDEAPGNSGNAPGNSGNAPGNSGNADGNRGNADGNRGSNDNGGGAADNGPPAGPPVDGPPGQGKP